MHPRQGCSCKPTLGAGRERGTGETGRSEHPEPHPAGARAAATTWGWSSGPRERGAAPGSRCQGPALQLHTGCSIPVRRRWPGLVAPRHRWCKGTRGGNRHRPKVCLQEGRGCSRGGFADTSFAAAGGESRLPEVLRVSRVENPCTLRRGAAEWAWGGKKYRWRSLLDIALSDAFGFSPAAPASPGSALGTGWSLLHTGRGAGCGRASGRGWRRAEAAHFS